MRRSWRTGDEDREETGKMEMAHDSSRGCHVRDPCRSTNHIQPPHKNMGHYRLTSFGTADAINVTILYTLVSTLSFL